MDGPSLGNKRSIRLVPGASGPAEQAQETRKRDARAKRIEAPNNQFDRDVGGILEAVWSAATELQSTSNSMAAIAEEMAAIAEETDNQATTEVSKTVTGLTQAMHEVGSAAGMMPYRISTTGTLQARIISVVVDPMTNVRRREWP